jgi:phosphotransferase system IIA component
MTKLEKALERTWLEGDVMKIDIDQDDIAVIRKHMVAKGVHVYFSDNEISCLWKSFITQIFNKQHKINHKRSQYFDK